VGNGKIAVVYYSTYGHVRQLALREKKGIENAGGVAELFTIEETMSKEALIAMQAPEKPGDLVITSAELAEYDGFLMGIPARLGSQPSQWRVFWEKTAAEWWSGAFMGKFAGVFVSTASPHSGAETVALTSLPTFVHHGIVFVPLGYMYGGNHIMNLTEMHSGSPWGASTLAEIDGSRQPSELELELAEIQGEQFYNVVRGHTPTRLPARGFGKRKSS
jgi:NAD(P)H dehydrogenase (quinone)